MFRIDPLVTWSTPFDRSLLIESGSVSCPQRGLVDVESCLACEFLLGVEGERRARIVCGYPLPVARTVANQLAAGRRWSRHLRIIEEYDEASEEDSMRKGILGVSESGD